MTLPVPTQSTWTVGEIVTAALMNKNVRDGVGFLTAPPIYVGFQNTAQSFANGTFTALTCDSETTDTYSGHSNTVNSSRYTAQVAGWYLVIGNISWSTNANGRRIARVYVNGGILPGWTESSVVSVGGSSNSSVMCFNIVYLNVGDYTEVYGYQSSGAALSSSAGFSQMVAVWMHS